MAAATRWAVVKSDCAARGAARAGRTAGIRVRARQWHRLAMRPLVGTPRTTEAASPLAEKTAGGDRTLRDGVDLAVGAHRGVTSRTPPCRLVASPSAETVTSMRVPWAAKAGRSAETMTAATLAVFSVVPRVLTPRRSSMPIRLCCVNGALRSVSPVLVEADHEAAADQHVVANAFDIDDVLDARTGVCLDRHGGGQRRRRARASGGAETKGLISQDMDQPINRLRYGVLLAKGMPFGGLTQLLDLYIFCFRGTEKPGFEGPAGISCRGAANPAAGACGAS